MTAHAAISGERYRRPKRCIAERNGKPFQVATIRAKGGVALSRSQLQGRLAVLIILGETLIRVEQPFQVRVINLLESLPEARYMSFRQGMSLCRAIIALTPIVIAAEGVVRRLRLLRDKIERSPNQKEDAMAPLQNLRQETFCQLVASGKSATAAYAGAYGRAHDVTSRVNGRRLLTDANICERIVEIRSGEASASLPSLRRIVEGAGQSAVQQIETGSFRRACQAAERFADMIIKLSA
ncbi:MAG TPA: hypothetical protein VIF02_13300 [Methylocella sp.]|jgi:hypothetical protein